MLIKGFAQTNLLSLGRKPPVIKSELFAPGEISLEEAAIYEPHFSP